MPSVAVLALILTIVLFFIALLFLRRNSKQKSCNAKLPPGNMGLPLIGETFAFLKPHSVFTAGDFLERQISKFGRIFLSNLMGSQVIVSADGELNRFVLKNEPRLFGPGWPLAFKKVAGKDSISVVVGEAHKALRSTVTEFLSGNRLRSVFLRDANELASLLISSWKEGSVISARDEATKFSLYIMAKEILSLRPGDPAIEKLRMEYESFVRGLGCLPLYVPGTLFWKALHVRNQPVFPP